MNKIEEDSIRFSHELDDKILPLMPKGNNVSVMAQRQFLSIIAERKAKLYAQVEWLHKQQEYYRNLRGE